MQGAIFAKILQMSVTGSYSIGVVLAVRLLLMRCGRRYAYQLWLLMFVSLCLPFSLPGNYSLIPGAVAEFSLTDGMPEEEPVQDRTGQETDAVDSEDRQAGAAAPAVAGRDFHRTGQTCAGWDKVCRAGYHSGGRKGETCRTGPGVLSDMGRENMVSGAPSAPSV